MYDSRTTKLRGKHRHTRGLSLAQEADMVQQNILHSSGFFSGGRVGPNQGGSVGTINIGMEGFIGKWNRMNNRGSGRFKRSTHAYDKPYYL